MVVESEIIVVLLLLVLILVLVFLTLAFVTTEWPHLACLVLELILHAYLPTMLAHTHRYSWHCIAVVENRKCRTLLSQVYYHHLRVSKLHLPRQFASVAGFLHSHSLVRKSEQ